MPAPDPTSPADGDRPPRLMRHPARIAVSLVLALGAAAWIVAHGSGLQVAAASTHAVIETPNSTVASGSPEFAPLNERAVLLGNLGASAAVSDRIARRAGLPRGEVQVAPPLTPDAPRPVADSGHEKHASDLLAPPADYRVSIELDPESSLLNIYATAPDAGAAERLANAAVPALNEYLRSIPAPEAAPSGYGLEVRQLGRAEGGTVNGSVSAQAALVAFLLTFCAAMLAAGLLARMGRWYRAVSRRASPA